MYFSCALHYTASPWQGQFTLTGSPLESMSVNLHCSFHPLTAIWIIKWANVQEAPFWKGFSPELKHSKSEFLSIVTASKGHLLD